MLVNDSDFYCGNASSQPTQLAKYSDIPNAISKHTGALKISPVLTFCTKNEPIGSIMVYSKDGSLSYYNELTETEDDFAYQSDITSLKSQIPDVSGYAKSSDLESLKSSVSNGKQLVANAITGKGVTTSSSESFATMANKIGSISTEKTYGTFRYYKSLDTNTYYVGRIIYLSAFKKTSNTCFINGSLYAGPGYVLFHDSDGDTSWAIYRNSNGELVESEEVGRNPTITGGPFTDGTYYVYYSSYYRQYIVDSNGLRETGQYYSDESSLSNGRTKYSQNQLGFISTASYGGSSKISRSFYIYYGMYGNDALPILGGDASSDFRRYVSYTNCIIDDYNGYPGFICIPSNFYPALYQYDSSAHVVPCGDVSISLFNMLRVMGQGSGDYVMELPYKAKILENNGSSLLLQNLGPA